jgi:hypothetical protein
MRLQVALARAGGLPLVLETDALDDSPALRTRIAGLIDAVEVVGDDPDDLIESDELERLLAAMDLGVIELDDIVDPATVPTDDLMRFGRLKTWRKQRAIAVYAEEMPRR